MMVVCSSMLKRLRSGLQHNFPGLHAVMNRLGHWRYKLGTVRHLGKPPERVFSDILQRQRWGTGGSSCGPGSSLQQTSTVARELPRLIARAEVSSLLDAPCGDFHWMQQIELNVERYIGVDVVGDLIESNRKLYSAPDRHFEKLDIISDPLPRADLILCRDCLVHLPLKDIQNVLRNFKQSGASFLLTTTYPGIVPKNRNIIPGNWRPLDLQRPPFDFPPPLELLNERCTEEGDFPEKSLGLWKLDDLQV